MIRNLHIVKRLVEFGANFEIKDEKGNTPLIIGN
jgi:ankyrin repeat protein